MLLEIKIREINGVSVLDVTGALVHGSAKTLRDEIRRLLAENKSKLLLNFDAITRMDESGVGVLVAVWQSVRQTGGSLKMLKPGRCIRMAFAAVGIIGCRRVEDFCEIYEDEAA